MVSDPAFPSLMVSKLLYVMETMDASHHPKSSEKGPRWSPSQVTSRGKAGEQPQQCPQGHGLRALAAGCLWGSHGPCVAPGPGVGEPLKKAGQAS